MGVLNINKRGFREWPNIFVKYGNYIQHNISTQNTSYSEMLKKKKKKEQNLFNNKHNNNGFRYTQNKKEKKENRIYSTIPKKHQIQIYTKQNKTKGK